MAHLAPPTGRHRHREQLLGLVLLLVGASMALLAITALIHPKSRPASLTPVAGESPQPSAGAEPVSAASAGSTPGPAPVIVLQNTGDLELAGSVAASFAAGGWTVTETSTFNGDSSSMAAYYDPAVAGAQAAAAALQRQFAGIARVRPKFAGLPSGPIVVVVANDYSRGRTTS